MKSFIVTFYRHSGKNATGTVLGIVEEAGVTGPKTFSSLDELWNFLGDAGVKRNKKNRPRCGSEERL